MDKRTCRVLLIGMLSISTVASVYAQSQETVILNPSDTTAPASTVKGLEGAWMVQLALATLSLGSPRFQALITYATGGGLVETDTAPSNFLTTSESPGHGSWLLTGTRYFLTLIKFRFDGSGNLIGTTRMTEALTLDKTLDRYAGSGKLDILDLNGNILFSTTYTSQATRIAASP
jgi:hypothetical protein